MSEAEQPPTGALIVERGRDGEPYYAAKWRWQGHQIKRRLGPAWLERAPGGSWRRRRGRPGAGDLDEKRAIVAMAAAIKQHAEDEAARDEQQRRAGERSKTFRSLAHRWLSHVEKVVRAKPSTLRSYRTLLSEPGQPYRRGRGTTSGRIMAAFGDRPASSITTEDIERYLDSLDDGLAPRTINWHRQTLAAIFNFGATRRYGLTHNPAAQAPKRREPRPRRLETYSVEEIEALARAAFAGAGRPDGARDAEQLHIDGQDAELFRIASFTGLRQGEMVALRWRDVDWSERVLVVERARSGDREVAPKSGHVRYVPLADQALAALERLSKRGDFTSANDYVFCSIAGGPLDPSALRRRFVRARDAAGLPRLRFHDLRHTAGSLLVRVLDPVTVRDILGHASIHTTERYLHARRAAGLADAATAAFELETLARTNTRRDQLVSMIESLGEDEVTRLLETGRSSTGTEAA